jgi:hypothetical protein
MSSTPQLVTLLAELSSLCIEMNSANLSRIEVVHICPVILVLVVLNLRTLLSFIGQQLFAAFEGILRPITTHCPRDAWRSLF